MGLCVVLEGETGEEVERLNDPQNLLHKVLPDAGDKAYDLLRFVDRYGDTVFNRLQAEQVLIELKRLKATVRGRDEGAMLDQIMTLALRCSGGPHLYLKFYGD